MPENLYPQLPTAPPMNQESFNIEMVRKFYQDIVNLKEKYTEKQRKYKNAYNRLLHASTGASSVALVSGVSTIGISVTIVGLPISASLASDLCSLPHDKFKKKTYKYALNIVEVASRYKGSYQLTSKNAKEVAQAFQRIYEIRH